MIFNHEYVKIKLLNVFFTWDLPVKTGVITVTLVTLQWHAAILVTFFKLNWLQAFDGSKQVKILQNPAPKEDFNGFLSQVTFSVAQLTSDFHSVAARFNSLREGCWKLTWHGCDSSFLIFILISSFSASDYKFSRVFLVLFHKKNCRHSPPIECSVLVVIQNMWELHCGISFVI